MDPIPTAVARKQGTPAKGWRRSKDEKSRLDKRDSSRIDLARVLNIGASKVDQLIYLERHASKEMRDSLNRGTISVNMAYKETRSLIQVKVSSHADRQIIASIRTSNSTDTSLKHDGKADWFDKNIEDECLRLVWREVVKLKRKIENEIGLVYIKDLNEILTKGDHLNYKEVWIKGIDKWYR